MEAAGPSPRSAMRPPSSTAPRTRASRSSKAERVTGFANSEEEVVGLTKVVPFLVEDELRRLGGLYEKAADWADFTPDRRAVW